MNEAYLIKNLIFTIQLHRTLDCLHPLWPLLHIYLNLRRLLIEKTLIIQHTSADAYHSLYVRRAASAVESRAASWAEVGVDFLEEA